MIQEVDEDLLDFAHKTFYEYFLAFYFCKTCNNEKIINLLHEWIGDSNYDELARLIIEVVIQNNDPKQHDHIICYLFELLFKEYVTGEENPNKRDVFAVVSDLYMHNLLQPKYQYKYNKFVLYNPSIIYHLNSMSIQRKIKNNLTLYDSKIVGELFLKDYKNGKLIDTIDSIYYLNNEFKKIVISSDSSSLLFYVNELFTAFNEIHRRSKTNMSNIGIIEHFMNVSIEYTLKYPQIFMTVIALIIKTKFDTTIERLLKYEFAPRNVFYHYTTPEILFELVRKAMNSKVYFALFLSVSIDCALKESNFIYEYLLIHGTRTSGNNEYEDNLSQFCIELWQLLNNSDSFEAFKIGICKINMYDNQYEYLYKRIYKNYIDSEKGFNDKHIKRFIAQQKDKTD